MDKNTGIALQTIGRVLESAAFIFTDQLSAAEIPLVDTWEAEGVGLSFTGTTRSGELHMWVSTGFACIAAANMLGVDAQSDSAQAKGLDALKELLNMVVGNFLTAAFGDEQVFELGLPLSLPHETLIQENSCEQQIWLQAEDNPVLFTIYYTDAA